MIRHQSHSTKTNQNLLQSYQASRSKQKVLLHALTLWKSLQLDFKGSDKKQKRVKKLFFFSKQSRKNEGR